jgi:predicted esterase
MDNESLKDAIELIRSGQKQRAQKLLQTLLRSDVHNIPIWFWYIETCSTMEQRLQVLEICAKNNPDNLQVRAALDMLRKKTVQPATVPESRPQQDSAKSESTNDESILTGVTQVTENPFPRERRNKKIQVMERPIKKPLSPAAFLVWLLAGVLVVGLPLLAIYILKSTPADPSSYRYTHPIEYYLYIPKAYVPDRAWPLFIGFHGSGGSGLDCWNLWQPNAEKEGFILLCPTLSDSSGGWLQSDGEKNSWAVINLVINQYNIKPGFFLVGFSAGAQFVQGFCFDFPQSVQAVAVLSARHYYSPSPGAKGIPFLVVIGDRDDPAAVSSSMQFSQALANNGSGVNYWLLPGIGHSISNKTKQLTMDFYRAVNKQ